MKACATGGENVGVEPDLLLASLPSPVAESPHFCPMNMGTLISLKQVAMRIYSVDEVLA